MVRLRTLDPPIGVRVPASQPNILHELRAVKRLPVISLWGLCVPTLLKSMILASKWRNVRRFLLPQDQGRTVAITRQRRG
jgi:hypothetical protein